jgi:hypothetical protein
MKLPRQQPVLFSYQPCEPLKQMLVESHTYPFLPGNFVSANWLKLFERLGGSRDWIIGQCQAESPSKRKTGSIRLLGLTIDTFHGSNMLGQGHAVCVALACSSIRKGFRESGESSALRNHHMLTSQPLRNHHTLRLRQQSTGSSSTPSMEIAFDGYSAEAGLQHQQRVKWGPMQIEI